MPYLFEKNAYVFIQLAKTKKHCVIYKGQLNCPSGSFSVDTQEL